MARLLLFAIVVAVIANFFARGLIPSNFAARRNRRPTTSQWNGKVLLHEGRGSRDSYESSIKGKPNSTLAETSVGERTRRGDRRPLKKRQFSPGQRRQRRDWGDSERDESFRSAIKELKGLKSAQQIEEWVKAFLDAENEHNAGVSTWTVRAQVEFVKFLQKARCYDAIMMTLKSLKRPNVKVCTTAIFAMAGSSRCRHYAMDILDLMDNRQTLPTALTFIAVLGAVDGPVATSNLMNRLEGYKDVQWNTEVYDSAIYACRRLSRRDQSGEKDWQMALRLLQSMRRKGIQPSLKTYHAVLQALARAGKVQMAKSLLTQLQNTPDLKPDDRIWASAVNVCAEAGDFLGAIDLINQMTRSGTTPNLFHCSALLKAFKQSGQDQLATYALSMMLGEEHMEMSSEEANFVLPVTPPDLIAINTIIAACARAGNFEDAVEVFTRLKRGDFFDPASKRRLLPDKISYHNLLTACREPSVAKDIVEEMREEARVLPSNVTYAHAITVCQRSDEPDVECAETLLEWALEDGIQPTVYMFAPAIWAAQKTGDSVTALELFVLMEDFGCEANEVVLNGVISALSDTHDIEHAILLYDEMKSKGLRLSGTAYKHLALGIQSLESIEDRQSNLEYVLSLMNKSEKRANVGVPILEALIGVYGSQSLVDKAIETFESIEGDVDGASLRAVLLACSLADPPRWQEAISILHTSDILEDATGPGRIDQIALGNAIIACSKANEFEEALTLLELYGQRDESKSNESAASLSIVAVNSLIAACGRCRRPELSLMLLNRMASQYSVKPDLRSYRCAAIACNKAQHSLRSSSILEPLSAGSEERDGYEWWECSLSLLRRMREEGIKPDVATYSASISACEAAGKWQRALGVLQMMMDDDESLETEESLLNLYCFNAAISACEKGGAWVEALELYERMLDIQGPIRPNIVTLNSLLVALDSAGQKELSQTLYREAYKLQIVNPWRQTKDAEGANIRAMDLHRFSAAMAKAAVRNVMEDILRKGSGEPIVDVVIITGKGRRSEKEPVLKGAVLDVLCHDFQVEAQVDAANEGRVILTSQILREYVARNTW